MKQISVKEFEQVLKATPAGVECINVCSPFEYNMMPLKGVRNVPLQELVSRVEEFAQTKTLYVMCLSGARSEYAINLLHSLGVKAEMVNVDGGVGAWVRAGCTV